MFGSLSPSPVHLYLVLLERLRILLAPFRCDANDIGGSLILTGVGRYTTINNKEGSPFPAAHRLVPDLHGYGFLLRSARLKELFLVYIQSSISY